MVLVQVKRTTNVIYIALDRSLLSLTVLGSDYLGPSSREVSFMEGAESNETACISVVIVDDNDYEPNTQLFVAYISASLISTENTFFGTSIATVIAINDTRGKNMVYAG